MRWVRCGAAPPVAFAARSAARGAEPPLAHLTCAPRGASLRAAAFAAPDGWGCERCRSASAPPNCARFPQKSSPLRSVLAAKPVFAEARKTQPTASFHPSRNAYRPFVRVLRVFTRAAPESSTLGEAAPPCCPEQRYSGRENEGPHSRAPGHAPRAPATPSPLQCQGAANQ